MTKESMELLMTLPQSLRNELVNNLYRSEEILWVGTPCFRRTDDYGALYYFMSLVMLFCSVGIINKIVKVRGNAPDMMSSDIFLIMIISGLIMITCGLFFMPSYQMFIAKRTGYIITNSRAIIIKPDSLCPWRSSAKSYRVTTDLIVEIKMDGTRGDIIFGESVTGYISSHMGNGFSVTAPSKKKYGFMKCPNAKDVANFIYEYAQYLAANH